MYNQEPTNENKKKIAAVPRVKLQKILPNVPIYANKAYMHMNTSSCKCHLLRHLIVNNNDFKTWYLQCSI